MLNFKSNKKGEGILNIIIYLGILGLIMVIGIILAFGGMIVKWTADNIYPDLSTLGSVGDANLTQISTYTLKPIDNVVGSFSWMSGIVYILAIILMLGLAFAFRINGNKWMMIVFFAGMFLLIVSSIFLSNIYQDFYEDTGAVGTGLHEMALLSFLILYSPLIITVIGFVGGIIMFSGREEEIYG